MKNFLKFLAVVILTIFTCACDSDKSVVLFNKHPFDAQTINDSVSNTNVFKSGERIYYLVTLPKPVETKLLLIQIYKIGGDKDERYGYELVWGKRVKLRDEQKYYFTDYVVLNKEGAYVIKVYSRDNPTQILTTGNFYIKN
ncbi:hypothetical protein IJ541_05730 [bacterium]|nr:hypothetical protein [bacterium]